MVARPSRPLFWAVVAACALPLWVARVAAQDLEPRAYSNLPIGLNFLVLGYGYSDGALATEATAPLQDAEIEGHGPVLGFARSIAIRGRSAKVDVIVPYGWVSGTATYAGQPRQRDVSGFGDPRLRLSMNLYGAPALSLAEFADYEQDLIVGASLQVAMPLGQYDPEKLLNQGTNRWTIKPEIGLSKTWKPLTFELAAAFATYTDNEDYLDGHTLKQQAVYSLQSHLLYSFPWHIWAALDFTYYGGGASTVDGADSGERLASTRLGATLSLPLSRYQSMKLFGSTGLSTRTGSDFDAIGILWQYRWGAGL